MGFFDTYSRYARGGGISHTGAHENRLNERYRAFIDFNKDIIRNSAVLDLGSHDGRWSFAALKNGATKVIGVEGRNDLVKQSYNHMEYYLIPKEQFNFIQGDALEEIKKMEPNTIDVVFCLGFFYHVMYHMDLLYQVKRLKAKYLILDTSISGEEKPVIEIIPEDADLQQSGIKTNYASSTQHLAGYPSKSAVELMLKNVGFQLKYYDWQNAGIKDWTQINDYRVNRRLSICATNMD